MTQRAGILSIFVGQTGVQISNSFWQLLCAEHSIDMEGEFQDVDEQGELRYSFFRILDNLRCVPRTIIVDLEPSVIDEVLHGSLRTLFNPDVLISGCEDSGGNFARGFYTVGKLLIPKICEQLRKVFESDIINGIILFRSLGGGTGSGLTSAIFDTLIDLPKVTKIEIPIYPSPLISSSIVEPYNAILSEHFCMEDVNLGLLFDNEAMYNICQHNFGVENPTFNSINHIVSQTISCITSNIRFQSILNCDLNVIQTNLVPYPRIHFPISNIAPIMSADIMIHNRVTVKDITHSLFEPSNSLVSVDKTKGKYMSCSLFYRGSVSPSDVFESLKSIKDNNELQFVNWCPTGFKISISYQNQMYLPKSVFAPTTRSVAMLSNNSSVSQAWMKLICKFRVLYVKRVFMHWFIGEGLEEIEFNEAQMNIASLIQDYVESSKNFSSTSEPKSTTVESKSKTVESKSKTVESKSTKAESKSTKAESKSTKAETKSTKSTSVNHTESSFANSKDSTPSNTSESSHSTSKRFTNLASHANSTSILTKPTSKSSTTNMVGTSSVDDCKLSVTKTKPSAYSKMSSLLTTNFYSVKSSSISSKTSKLQKTKTDFSDKIPTKQKSKLTIDSKLYAVSDTETTKLSNDSDGSSSNLKKESTNLSNEMQDETNLMKHSNVVVTTTVRSKNADVTRVTSLYYQGKTSNVNKNNVAERGYSVSHVEYQSTNANANKIIQPLDINSSFQNSPQSLNPIINPPDDTAEEDLISRLASNILSKHINDGLFRKIIEQLIIDCKCLYNSEWTDFHNFSQMPEKENLLVVDNNYFKLENTERKRMYINEPLLGIRKMF